MDERHWDKNRAFSSTATGQYTYEGTRGLLGAFLVRVRRQRGWRRYVAYVVFASLALGTVASLAFMVPWAWISD